MTRTAAQRLEAIAAVVATEAVARQLEVTVAAAITNLPVQQIQEVPVVQKAIIVLTEDKIKLRKYLRKRLKRALLFLITHIYIIYNQ